MKKIGISLLIVLSATCFMGLGCSENKDVESEKGIIENMSDKAAEKIADRILEPVENAKEIKDMEDDRLKSLDDAMSQE